MDAAQDAFTADLPQSVGLKTNDVFKIDVFNLANLGQQHSSGSNLIDMIAVVTSQTSAFSKRYVAVFILPNTPRWGKGGQGKLSAEEWDNLVEEAEEDVRNNLKLKARVKFQTKEVACQFEEPLTAHQADRPLRFHIILCASDLRDAGGLFVNEFVLKSKLWRTKTAPPFKFMPRAGFRDWSKSLDLLDVSRKDIHVERRQYLSGEDFYVKILERLFSGLSTTSRDVAHIRDWALHDDSMIRAIVHLRKEKTLPILGFAGATWENFINKSAGPVVRANVFSSACDHVTVLLKESEYSIPGFSPLVVPRSPQQCGPTLPKFQLCQVRDQELPLKQAKIDLFSRVESFQLQSEPGRTP